jgi:hypothetical protein
MLLGAARSLTIAIVGSIWVDSQTAAYRTTRWLLSQMVPVCAQPPLSWRPRHRMAISRPHRYWHQCRIHVTALRWD